MNGKQPVTMRFLPVFIALLILVSAGLAAAATVVPTDIEQPGTQPGEVGNLESPDRCDNCHGGYDNAVEPAFNWRGSMMANAGRDPIFWATMAIAEQDFDGSGDLCIRCHSTGGWYAGRSTPTDGSALTAGDADGVDCDTCHKMTNPNNSEHVGVMNAPYQANNEQAPATGYYGSGMLALSDGSAKLGPYAQTVARSDCSSPPVCPVAVPSQRRFLRLLPRRVKPGRGRPGAQQWNPAIGRSGRR